MVVHRRKKVTKYRGSVTHGGGSRKKRRGAGSRGGRGNAGTGKRAGQKKAGLKNFHLGRHGFVRHPLAEQYKIINVGDLTLPKVQKWGTKEGDTYVVDLTKIHCGKLLGTGNTHLKLKVIVPRHSAQAEEKIKAAGGSIVSSVEQ
ncbi:uL15 family ribosomal protein [Candidatus Woesearchaeota archaeon]|nr:uL15 family ribosomal protein [Candidatus Woesearchaeota archaeon]